MAVGLRIWNQAGGLVFDTTSLAGRYASTLAFGGPAQGNFAIPGLQPGNEVWLNVQHYNVPFLNLQDCVVSLINGTTIAYDLRNLPAGSVTDIHYGWK